MGVRDEAGLRLGDAFIGELLPRALIVLMTMQRYDDFRN